MEEKKKRLGYAVDESTGETLEIVSAFVGVFANDTRVYVSRTDTGKYLLGVKTHDDEGVMTEKQITLSKIELSALLNGIFMFIDGEKTDINEFANFSIDEVSQCLYKNVDQTENEQ